MNEKHNLINKCSFCGKSKNEVKDFLQVMMLQFVQNVLIFLL